MFFKSIKNFSLLKHVGLGKSYFDPKKCQQYEFRLFFKLLQMTNVLLC